jgi:hypothetical protein
MKDLGHKRHKDIVENCILGSRFWDPGFERAYHEKDETKVTSRVASSIPLWVILLNLRERGKGILTMTNPEKK